MGRVLRRVSCATLLIAFTAAAPQRAWGERPACDLHSRLRVSVLFDNSGTVVERQRGLEGQAQEWLAAVVSSLRPGDRMQVFRLLPERGSELPLATGYDIPEGAWPPTVIAESARAVIRLLFDHDRANSRSDFKASLTGLQTILERDSARYCGEAVVLVSDGTLHPFYDSNGAVPDPLQSVNDFEQYVARRRGLSSGFHYYAVSLGASSEPSIDRQYRRDWESAGHTFPPELLDRGGRDLLETAFGKVYGLSVHSAEMMIYRDSTSVYGSLFGLRVERPQSLDILSDRAVRYVLIEEPPGVEKSACDDGPPSDDVPVRWTRAGSRCMIHLDRLSPAVARRYRDATWVALASAYTATSLPESISDPHQLVFQETGSEYRGSCSTARLFAMVSDGSWPSSTSATDYVLEYQMSRGSFASPPATIPLRVLRGSGCLVAASPGEMDPVGDYDTIRVTLRARDNRVQQTLLDDKRPWKPSRIVRWQLHAERGLLTFLVFPNHWFVSGTMLVRQDVRSSATPQLYIGDRHFPFLSPKPGSSCAVEGVTASTSETCLELGGTYVSSGTPSLARLSLEDDCTTSAAVCHFADLVPGKRGVRMSWSAIAFLAVVGMAGGLMLGCIRIEGGWSALRNRQRLTKFGTYVVMGGAAAVWLGEVHAWVSPFAGPAVATGQFVVPVLVFFACVFCPRAVAPLLRILIVP